MSNDHIVELPKAVWGIKIAQTGIAVLVLGLQAYNASIIIYSAFSFGIFAVSQSRTQTLALLNY